MKKIQIRPLRHLIVLIALFVFFNLLNAWSIVHYKTAWSELTSEMGFVLLLTSGAFLIYIVIGLIVSLIIGSKR